MSSSDARTMARRVLVLAIAMVAAAGAARAQPAAGADGGTVNLEVDPIRCWWHTSAGAVRVGEAFSVVLTCAVIENQQAVVAPDQSTLEPTALQLPPFEVLGGTHFADSRTADRRFFQYEYRVRLIQDDAFGADAPLPPIEVKYRIRTRTPDGASVEGRELSYILPTTSVRVLSLVPEDASDIRDASGETFRDLDAQAFRANALRVLAGVLFTLGVIMAILALVRLGSTLFRREAVVTQLLPDAAVLRGAARELADVKRLRERQDWSEALAGRALSALRIVGSYALGRRTSQALAPETFEADAGHLALGGGPFRGRRVHVSGSVTGATVAPALAVAEAGGRRREDLEQLQTALVRFASVQYGRDGAPLDEAVLDESLENGLNLARRLATQHIWPVKKFNALKGSAADLGKRVWSR